MTFLSLFQLKFHLYSSSKCFFFLKGSMKQQKSADKQKHPCIHSHKYRHAPIQTDIQIKCAQLQRKVFRLVSNSVGASLRSVDKLLHSFENLKIPSMHRGDFHLVTRANCWDCKQTACLKCAVEPHSFVWMSNLGFVWKTHKQRIATHEFL